MPWFSRKTEEERAQEEALKRAALEQRAEQQESLASLERGGLPLQARRRLQDLRERGGGLFTSDLSVNEFLLGREAGLQPITQVMGSSIYHVGWQYMPRNWWSSGSQELSVISEAMSRARDLALGRMQQEAQLAGADAVVGVRIERSSYDWGKDLIEFNAVGTAVRVPNAPVTRQSMALTNLSGQDFWKLFKSGYWPRGVVASSTVFYVMASWRTQMANNNSWWGGGWANQELTDFTQGVYNARHIVMSRIHRQTSGLSGGVVGVELEQEAEEYEVELSDDSRRTDMIFTFHAIGTAIDEVVEHPTTPPVYQSVNLRS